MFVSSRNEEEHLVHLNVFIDLCEKHGIGLSKAKSVIRESKTDFLGLKINSSGIELQPHIVEKIHNFPEKIKDRKQLQRFLGLLNYAEGFIKNLVDLRKPFKKLISEKQRYEFTKEHEYQIKYINEKRSQLEEKITKLGRGYVTIAGMYSDYAKHLIDHED